MRTRSGVIGAHTHLLLERRRVRKSDATRRFESKSGISMAMMEITLILRPPVYSSNAQHTHTAECCLIWSCCCWCVCFYSHAARFDFKGAAAAAKKWDFTVGFIIQSDSTRREGERSCNNNLMAPHESVCVSLLSLFLYGVNSFEMERARAVQNNVPAAH